jgi:hypothetical protein
MTDEIRKCIEAQENYCNEHGYPIFMPVNGKCGRCGHQIFDVISLKGASNSLITGCPICHYSFCE